MALPQDGQNANALATVKEVPTGKKLIFVDPTTNEGGVITLEDLTTQILKNLTSQTFALDQGTKTLPAALNELNSNRVAVYIGKITTSKTGEIATNNFINGSSIKNIIAVKIFDSAGSRNVHTELYSYKTYAFVVAKNDVGDRLVNTELDIVAFYIK
jgi:hypothetical protein